MAETIYYDGHCGLCHGFVKFVLARDESARFRFAPLDKLSADERAGLPESVVVRTPQGMLVKSDAALHVLVALGGPWRVLGRIGSWFPRSLRNWVYDGIAAIRYRIFGRRENACPLIPPGLRSRFDL